MCQDCGERPPWAKGACLRCYRRRRRGAAPLKQAPVSRYGQPDGHGRYGMLDDDGTSVLCHECGRRYAALASHTLLAHGMDAASYRSAHGLGRRTPLLASGLREAQGRRARERIGGPGWQRFEAARDPQAASQARDLADLRDRAETHHARALQATEMGKNTPRAAPRTCPRCGTTWVPGPGRYRARHCGAPTCAPSTRKKNTTPRTA